MGGRPTSVFGSVMALKPLDEAALPRRERPHKVTRWFVGVEITLDQGDLRCVGKPRVGNFLEQVCAIHGGVAIGHLGDDLCAVRTH
jgi:hypothetical protein